MKTPKEKRFDRRSFIKAGGAGLTGLALARRSIRAQSAARGADYSQRRVYPLNHRWLYSERVVPGGTDRDFDDAGFTRVNIPHTNRLLPWHGFDDREYEFVSLYRRRFRVPAEVARRARAFVDFGGVMTAATVFLKGARLGDYRGGYTPFSFELTEHLDPRGDNVLAVEVDSTERADIPPFGGGPHTPHREAPDARRESGRDTRAPDAGRRAFDLKAAGVRGPGRNKRC